MVSRINKAEDTIPWLQAGLLAFKHAMLCKRLIFRDPQVRVSEAEENGISQPWSTRKHGFS